MADGWMENKGGKIFAETQLSKLSFDEAVGVVMDLIKEFGESGVFGKIVRWRPTNLAYDQSLTSVTEIYKKEHGRDKLNSSDRDEVYRLVIARYMQMCLCHERFMLANIANHDVQHIGLSELPGDEPYRLLYGMCRVHEDEGATLIGFTPDSLDSNHRVGLFLITTEEEAMELMPRSNVVISPVVGDHKTIYFIDPHYQFPLNIPDDYQIIVRK